MWLQCLNTLSENHHIIQFVPESCLFHIWFPKCVIVIGSFPQGSFPLLCPHLSPLVPFPSSPLTLWPEWLFCYADWLCCSRKPETSRSLPWRLKTQEQRLAYSGQQINLSVYLSFFIHSAECARCPRPFVLLCLTHFWEAFQASLTYAFPNSPEQFCCQPA